MAPQNDSQKAAKKSGNLLPRGRLCLLGNWWTSLEIKSHVVQ